MFLPPQRVSLRKKGNISPSGLFHYVRGKITPHLITDWFLRTAFVRSRKGWSCYPISQKERAERRGAVERAAKRRQLFCRSHPTSRITTHLHTATALCNPIHTQRKGKKQPLLLLMLSSHFLWALFEQWAVASKSHIRWVAEKYGACQNRNCHVSWVLAEMQPDLYLGNKEKHKPCAEKWKSIWNGIKIKACPFIALFMFRVRIRNQKLYKLYENLCFTIFLFIN